VLTNFNGPAIKSDTHKCEDMRYATIVQSLYNRCQKASNKYHGMTCKGTMSIIPFDRITCDYIKYNIWGMLLDNYLQFGKIPELPPRKDSYIDTNSCRYKALKEDAAHLLPLLNTFIYHVKKLDNSIVYTQYTMKSDIKVSSEFLKGILSYYPENTLIYGLCPKKQVIGALVWDLWKIKEAGEFAHTNFIKTPEPSSKIKVHTKSPADILNMFEQERDRKYKDSRLVNKDFDVNLNGMFSTYTMGENGIINMTYCESTDVFPTNLKEVGTNEIIKSPCSYYR